MLAEDHSGFDISGEALFVELMMQLDKAKNHHECTNVDWLRQELRASKEEAHSLRARVSSLKDKIISKLLNFLMVPTRSPDPFLDLTRSAR